MKPTWSDKLTERTKGMSGSVIREILKLTQQPDIISFAGGLPAPEVFPVEKFKQASQVVYEQHGTQALQYGLTEGYTPLREWVCGMYKQQGLTIEPDNLFLTNGSQQALDLIGKIFIEPGDKILVESPTYLGAILAWDAYGAEYVQVEMDDDGIIPEALEKACAENPKFMYLLPNFQNPTGRCMSKERRKQVVEIADQHGVPILEDDPYGNLRYTGEHLDSLLLTDAVHRQMTDKPYSGNVVYMSTFSKIMAPGIRLAWTIGPKDVIQKMIFAKQRTDLHTSTLVQMIAYEIAKDGYLDEHIEVIREVYGRRRKLMLDSIAEFFPAEAQYTKPEGGMFLWVTLPEQINTTELLKKAVEKKVAYVPGSPFFPRGGGENTMRLNFSNATDKNVIEGMHRLGETIREELIKV